MGGIVIIVKQDEIDIRTGRQLEGAELAHAHDSHAPAGIEPMRRFHLRQNGVERGLDHQIGKVGEGAGGNLAADCAGEKPHADQEALFGSENAQPVENILIMPGIGEKASHAVGEIIARRHVAHQCRVQHAVEDMRTGGDDFGKARCGRHDRHQQVEQRRVVAEQRKELDAGRQAGEEIIETQQCLIGPFAFTEGAQQVRCQLRQPFARLHRLRRTVTAIVPCG